ncbi:MAG: UDP-N-acetylmuramate--L-alanine ligase [Candidatus Dormibacteraeota bacterium]|nr:UDP-N-acetylmuramate--L-alanine ligase [Candidatus Dormibacteraeota bacterium]
MTRHVHVLGICGYAAGGAALLARDAGDVVTGSDDFAYPPMSDTITASGIAWQNHSDPANLDRWGVPDLVVVGNQTRLQNAEWVAVQQRGLPYVSEIAFFVSLAGDRLRLTVCGTHGKTTTSALLVHMLSRAGSDPGFRLGATSLDVGGSARLGTGPFVFEGDEYTTAPWDTRPKFVHTQPRASCVTRLEWDHPDVYPSFESYRAPFVDLAQAMPSDGLLALCADDAQSLALRDHASCRVVTYGAAAGADWRISGSADDGARQRFIVERSSASPLQVALTFPGAHNACNATAALILASYAGVDEATAVAACATFRGPARRFEILGEVAGVTVVDDYAHHPTEVGAAIDAARSRYGSRRLIAVHTPHTYSRTRTLLEDYRESFQQADVAIIGPIEEARERGQPATVSSDDVATRAAAPEVHVVRSSDAAIDLVTSRTQPGDVVLVLSLGGFDKLAPRLVAALEAARVPG